MTTTMQSILNIDAICPPELREEAAALTAEIRAMEPTLRELCRRVHDLEERLESATEPANDELSALMNKVEPDAEVWPITYAASGQDQLHEAFRDLADLMSTTSDGGAKATEVLMSAGEDQ